MDPKFTLKSRLKLTASVLALPLGSIGYSAAAQAQVIDDEIIVTATRRAESIQDIPINISAIGGEQIEQQGFGDISELAAFVPGLNIADQGGRDGNRIVVRGLNVEDIQNSFGQENGGGTVATYVGEIPLFVDLRLNDLQRVEVLLGPQGTLYGAGTMGGAIRYIPNKPDFDSQLFEVRAGAYSYSEGSGISTDTGFTFNAPLSNNFALRGSLDFQNDKGFIDNPFVVRQPGVSEPDAFSDASNFRPIKDANTEEILSGRLAARWQPSDRLDATLTYYFQQGEYGGRNTSSFRTANIPATFGSQLTFDSGKYEFGARVEEPNQRDSDLLALEVVADLGFAELTSATGLATVEENGQRDQTDLLISLDYYYETFPTFTGFTSEDEETEIFNQELRLVSTAESRLSWIVGAFYNENKYNALSSEFTPGIGAFNADFGFRQDLNDLEYFEADRRRLKEKSVFGEVSYDVTEAWDVTFGMRYYDYDLETAGDTQFPYFTTAADFNPYPLSEIENQLSLAPNQSADGTLFKLNTSYQLGGGNTVYATFSQGYRVGVNNGGETCAGNYLTDQTQALCLYTPGQALRDGGTAILDERGATADTVDNFELGAKTTWLDGALRLNGAVFFMKWDNPQVSTTSINAGTSITVNAASAETKGVELDGAWQVSDRFGVRGNFSYTDANLTADVPGLVRQLNGQGNFTADFGYGFGTDPVNARDGDRLPGSPKTQFSVFGDYRHPLLSGDEVVFNAGYAWQGDVLTIVGGLGESYTLPSYGRANVALGYESDNWSLIGFVDNLFNDFSESSAANTPLNNQLVPAFGGDANPANVRRFRTNVLPPRSIGARFTYRFQ